VPIGGGLKIAPDDASLPPTAPPGQVWIVLSSARSGGRQTLYGYNPTANQWEELGGGGVALNLGAKNRVYSMGVPVGTVITYAGRTLPDGYLLCNGAQYDPLIYPELFAVLGEDRVPNLLDQFVRGAQRIDSSLPVKTVNKGRYLSPQGAATYADIEVFFRRRDLIVGDYVSVSGANTPPFPRGSNLPANQPMPGGGIIVYCGDGYGFEFALGNPNSITVSRAVPWYRGTTARPMHDFTAAGTTASAGDHVHSVAAVTSRGGGATTWIAGNTGGQAQNTGTAGAHTHTFTTPVSGGDVETMPMHVVMAYLIKARDAGLRMVP
jgi:hypothetical protein